MRTLLERNKWEIRKLVIRAMLNDNEVACGGIFQKEEYYMKKYNISQEEMGNMMSGVYAMLNNVTIEFGE